MMPWSRLDDGFHEHPKTVAMSDKAFRLYVCSITYSSRHCLAGRLKPGHITVLYRLTGAKVRQVQELVSLCAYEADGEDYIIHGFAKWNPVPTDLSLKRADAGRKGAERRWQTDGKPIASAIETDGKTPMAKMANEWQSDGNGNPLPLPLPLPLPEPLKGNTEEVTREVRKRTKPASSAPSAATWEAYRQAYMAAYHDRTGASIEPVRNATVNGQLARLVERLGAEEAPLVAAWYVGHRNAYYVQQGHSIGALLHDAEKLRTEWKAGVRLHARDVREIDRLSADGQMWADLAAERAAQKEIVG